MPVARLVTLTTIAMLAFAGNSLLCRRALAHTHIDPATFTTIRIVAGALALMALQLVVARTRSIGGSWRSGLALFAYAAAFSFAYTGLTTATGALLLFGAVQCSMIGYGLLKGERLNVAQTLGVVVAVAGLIYLLLPGLSAPPAVSAILMLGAGVAWGVYSLRGRGAKDATRETTGNFVRAVPFTAVASAAWFSHASIDPAGVGLAIASGAVTSGLGYAIWYTALPALSATRAATIQLSVPAIAAAGGVAILGESFTWRLAIASVAILGGVAIVILSRRRPS